MQPGRPDPRHRDSSLSKDPPFPSLALSGRPLPHSRATWTLALVHRSVRCAGCDKVPQPGHTNKCFLLTALEAGRQIKAPTASASGENPLPGYRPPISHWVLPWREGPERKSALHFFIRWLLPNPLPKPHLLTTTWGLGCPHRTGGRRWRGVGGGGGRISIQPTAVRVLPSVLN